MPSWFYEEANPRWDENLPEYYERAWGGPDDDELEPSFDHDFEEPDWDAQEQVDFAQLDAEVDRLTDGDRHDLAATSRVDRVIWNHITAPLMALLPTGPGERTQQAVRTLADRGRLAPADTTTKALSVAQAYTLMHSNEVKRALDELGYPARLGESVAVLDVGCGAGAVGIAMAQCLAIDQSLTYVGFDPHPTMVELADQVVRALAPPGTRIMTGISIDPRALRELVRASSTPLVVVSHLFHQPNLSDQDVVELANWIEALVAATERVHIVVVDSAFRDASKLPSFERRLVEFRLSIQRREASLSAPISYSVVAERPVPSFHSGRPLKKSVVELIVSGPL